MQRARIALPLLVCLAFPACGEEAQPPAAITGTVYEDVARGFRLTIPTGWTVNPSPSVTQHYLDLCFSVSNTRRSDLRIGDELHADGADYNEGTVARQLEVGNAYLDIGRWGGPPDFGMGGEKEEFEGANPGELVNEDALKRRQTAPLTTANVSCRKWGRDWNVQIYLREPVEAQTRREADFILQSIEFFRPDDPLWAASVARRVLPTEAKALGDWPIHPRANSGGCQTDVERVPAGFRVTFSDTGDVGGAVKRSWTFVVKPDGSVAAVDD